MPISARIGFLAATHPEASDWAARVVSNGGTVSSATLAAVNRFCRAIDTAGMRDRFLRLNLFAGSGLSAALVPLYRGRSYGGTTVGNATDTNVNFVSGDYAETGSSGGLKGNGSSKYLNTGLSPASLPSAPLAHLSLSGTSLETFASSQLGGVATYDGASSASYFGLEIWNTGAGRSGFLGNFAALSGSANTSESQVLVSRTATNSAAIYQGGSSVSTSTAVASYTTNTRPWFVFALNNAGSAQRFSAGRFRMYSIGLDVTATQASAFSAAVSAFNAELSR